MIRVTGELERGDKTEEGKERLGILGIKRTQEISTKSKQEQNSIITKQKAGTMI